MKPPCCECQRHKLFEARYINEKDLHYCVSKRINQVTGKSIIHECWWYRRTPFCKFKQKDDEE